MQALVSFSASLGLPLEAVVFIAVLLIMLVLMPVFITLHGGRSLQQKQAKKIRSRLQNTGSRTVELEIALSGSQSLRRAEGDSALPLLSDTIGQWDRITMLRDRLARAGMNITAERYLLNTGFLFAALSIIPILLQRSPLLCILMAVVASLGLPHFVVNFRIKRRAKKFLLLFPDAIDLIVRGLRAGLPVTESIKMVAKEIEQPVGGVFQTMTEKMALGVPLEKTLYDTAKKYSITEFDFFVTSIVLQRETGGNLSEILSNLSEALRQRTMMRLKIKAMSSEAKASMYIIGALPFFVVGALSLMSPLYLLPLIEDSRGNIALLIAGGMLFTGMFVMTRMTQFEI